MGTFAVVLSFCGFIPIVVAILLDRQAKARYPRNHPIRTITALIQLVMFFSWAIYVGGLLGSVGNVSAVVIAALVHIAMSVVVLLAIGQRNDAAWFFNWLELVLKAPQAAISNDKNEGFEA